MKEILLKVFFSNSKSMIVLGHSKAQMELEGVNLHTSSVQNTSTKVKNIRDIC